MMDKVTLYDVKCNHYASEYKQRRLSSMVLLNDTLYLEIGICSLNYPLIINLYYLNTGIICLK
jgi:hypothetical protein